MGMFDEIRFSYRMPDGYEGEYFQTKDLDCDGLMYEIDDEGRLLKEGKFLNFNGEFEMYYDEPIHGRSGDFRMVFDGGRLMYIIPTPGDIRYLFESKPRLDQVSNSVSVIDLFQVHNVTLNRMLES